MDNQGKTNRQLKSSYIGAFIGIVGTIIILILNALL